MIGERSNLGAGTIVVNYDGRDKHRTTIGDDVRIGSNNSLVAPVTVHDGAYTAAGSAITEDVPAGALGVGRARQRSIEGWVARKRAPRDTTTGEAPGMSGTAEHHREEPAAVLRPRLPRARGRGRRRARRRPRPDQRVRLRQRRDLRALRGVGARLATPSCCRATARRSTPGSWSSCSWSTRSSARAPSGSPSSCRSTRTPARTRSTAAASRSAPASIADLFKTAGADRLMTVDLHTAQIQGFFDGPVDHLFALPLLADHVEQQVGRPRPRRRLAGRRPGAGGRALDRPARLRPGDHPQAPRPQRAQRGQGRRGRRRGRAARPASSSTT